MLDNWMGRGQKGSDSPDKVGLGSIRRPVIGLALGGGAARGFAHIGILRTLIAHGIVPNVVVGTSIGAVIGGAYAAGHLDTLEEWARSLQREAGDNAPLWITEFGWSTCRIGSGWCVTPSDQASFIRSGFSALAAERNVKAGITYNLLPFIKGVSLV